MKATLTLGAPLSDSAGEEREASEVSPADAAAFLATLATAIHAVGQPLSAPNEADPFEFTEIDVGEGVFETALSDPAPATGDALFSSGDVRDGTVMAPVLAGSALGASSAAVGNSSTSTQGTQASRKAGGVVETTLPSNPSLVGTIVQPQRFEAATSFGGEYVAPALLLPSRVERLASQSAARTGVLEGGVPSASVLLGDAADVTTASASQASRGLHAEAPTHRLQGAPAKDGTTNSAAPKSAATQIAPIQAATQSATPESATTQSATPGSTTTQSATPGSATPGSATTQSATPGSAGTQSATTQSATPTKPQGTEPQSTTPQSAAAKGQSASAGAATSNLLVENKPLASAVNELPRQEVSAPLLSKAPAGPQLAQLHPVPTTKASEQRAVQTRGARGVGATAPRETSQDAVQPRTVAEPSRVERHHDDDAPIALKPPRAHQSPEPHAPDAVELAAPNPERSLADFQVAAPENQQSTATPLLSSAEAPPPSSNSSRLLEHLQASFPAAEVRISEGRAGETLVSMNHPDFGAVELNLQITSSGIDIAARVDGAIAASLLRRSEASLRRTIHRRGLSLGRLRVERNQKHSSRRPVRGIDLEA